MYKGGTVQWQLNLQALTVRQVAGAKDLNSVEKKNHGDVTHNIDRK